MSVNHCCETSCESSYTSNLWPSASSGYSGGCYRLRVVSYADDWSFFRLCGCRHCCLPGEQSYTPILKIGACSRAHERHDRAGVRMHLFRYNRGARCRSSSYSVRSTTAVVQLVQTYAKLINDHNTKDDDLSTVAIVSSQSLLFHGAAGKQLGGNQTLRLDV